jgi:hypothetical protein
MRYLLSSLYENSYFPFSIYIVLGIAVPKPSALPTSILKGGKKLGLSMIRL